MPKNVDAGFDRLVAFALVLVSIYEMLSKMFHYFAVAVRPWCKIARTTCTLAARILPLAAARDYRRLYIVVVFLLCKQSRESVIPVR